MSYDSSLADGSDLGEERILLDLKSPSLVVCKVPVESVELVYCHHVKISLHLCLVEEVTRNVHMQTTVFESRCIVDLHARKVPVLVCSGNLSVYLYRKHLLQSLHSVVEAAES